MPAGRDFWSRHDPLLTPTEACFRIPPSPRSPGSPSPKAKSKQSPRRDDAFFLHSPKGGIRLPLSPDRKELAQRSAFAPRRKIIRALSSVGILLALSILWAVSRQSQKATPVFALPAKPLSLRDGIDRFQYANHPVSQHRPTDQFVPSRLRRQNQPAVLAVITATRDGASHIFAATARSVLGQSLGVSLAWYIVDDGSNDVAYATYLRQLAASDSRIVLLSNHGPHGLSEARNLALRTIQQLDSRLQPRYFCSLDDDDLLELTAFEKAVWMLDTNPSWSFVSTYWARFGAKQGVEDGLGAHLGAVNYFADNYVANAAIVRWADLGSCRYDASLDDGGEDWDLWLCLAEHGHWGGTLPELLYWYRANPENRRKTRWGALFGDKLAALRNRIRDQHPVLHDESRFPQPVLQDSSQPELMNWEPAYRTSLDGERPSIILLSTLSSDNAVDLQLVRLFSQEGYRVTVVHLAIDQPLQDSSKFFARISPYTHDYQPLPLFLQPADVPRFLLHLARSRGTRHVLSHRLEVDPALLVHLQERLPGTTFSLVASDLLDKQSTLSLAAEHMHHIFALSVEIAQSYLPKQSVLAARGISVLSLRVDEVRETLGKGSPLIDLPLERDSYTVLVNAEADSGTLASIITGLLPSIDSVAQIVRYNFDTFTASIAVLGADEAPEWSEPILVGLDALIEDLDVGLFLGDSGDPALASALRHASIPFVFKTPSHAWFTDSIATITNTDCFATLPARNTSSEDVANKMSELYRSACQADTSFVPPPNTLFTESTSAAINMLEHLVAARPTYLPILSSARPHPYGLSYTLATFQSALVPVEREGIGRVYQMHCPDTWADMRDWIDRLEGSSACPGSHIDFDVVHKAAMHQCGSWCIWDLREGTEHASNDTLGWQIADGCIKQMWFPDCERFLPQRPAVRLAPSR